MNKLLLLLAMSVSVSTTAQNNSLSGNWREVRRTDTRGGNMNFQDTIKLNFLTGNEYTWMKKGGFIYRGTYKIENGALDMGARYFKIASQSSDRLVISDDAATYEFRPYTEAARTTLRREAPPRLVSDLSAIAGKWKVFKGTSSSTMKELDLSTRVKTVMIFDAPDAEGDVGYVSAGKDPQGKPSWKINRFENGILYCNGKTVRLFEVMKGEKELVLKEDNMTYFMKQFTE
ncbi:MAG TPA: hypothetical protein PL009_05335 [Flavipsychrobacter sp.]|nr:hypothetical protein [Flavipsychrobacter sp.]